MAWLTLSSAAAHVVAAGTPVESSHATLHLRLLTTLSTRVTASGDAFLAEVTRPLLDEANLAAIPVGARVEGRVVQSLGVGLGLKRERAQLGLRFDEIVLPNGDRLPLNGSLAAIDNAREDVDRTGRIRGIRATHNLAERMNVRLGGVRFTPFRLAYRSTMTAMPLPGMSLWFANGLIFGLTDPEIHYPPGSDFELRLHAAWAHPARFPVYRGERPAAPGEASALTEFVESQPSLSRFEKGGAEADPVNLVILGAPTPAFEAAGWHGADARGRRHCFRALRAIATAKPYQRGPMTPLLLAGQRPIAEWQKSLNTYAKRHHLRLWRASQDWQGQAAWLVAATHDTGLAVEGRRLTHSVDRRLDRERERIIADLLLTGCVDSVTYVHRPPTGVRPWITDGRVAVLQLNACQSPAEVTTLASTTPAGPSLRWRLLQRVTLNARNTLLRENNLYRGYDLVRHLVHWRKQSAD